MTPEEAIYRLNECECYNASLRCDGCCIAVETLTSLIRDNIKAQWKKIEPKPAQEWTAERVYSYNVLKHDFAVRLARDINADLAERKKADRCTFWSLPGPLP